MLTNQTFFSLIPEKVTRGSILLLQLCNSRPNRYASLDFVVLSLIIALYNVLTPHISKTHLPIVSRNVLKLEFNWSSKEQSIKKWGAPYVCGEGEGGRGGSPTLSANPYYLLGQLPLFMKVCVFKMWFNLNKCLPVMRMTWNELKNELKRIWMSLNQSKWAPMSLNEFK